MRFSQRMGQTPIPESISPEGMPGHLRNTLWNVFQSWQLPEGEEKFLFFLWRDFFKLPVDRIPSQSGYHGTSYHQAWEVVRNAFFGGKWHYVYDFLEFCLSFGYSSERLAYALNDALERELAAYRVVNGLLVQVTDEQEVAALQVAMTNQDAFKASTRHLSAALAQISNRQTPDYRNSIKESISAVEAAAKVLSGKDKADLRDALAVLERNGKLHGALQKAYTSLYAYTSDAEGIRHALMDEPNLTMDDAKFFLLSCTSFVNYLKASFK